MEAVVEVERINDLSLSSLAALTAAPAETAEMGAYDFRSTKGTCARYVVTNDFWPAESEVKPFLWHERQR